MWNWIKKNISKKMTATVLGGAVTAWAAAHGVPPGVSQTLLGLIGVYVLGQGVVDAVQVHTDGKVKIAQENPNIPAPTADPQGDPIDPKFIRYAKP